MTAKVRVAGHLPGRDTPVGFGDAWVLLVDFSKPGKAWSVLAYGQTTKPESPHSRDQLRLFADHKLRRAWYSEADIKANRLGSIDRVARLGLRSWREVRSHARVVDVRSALTRSPARPAKSPHPLREPPHPRVSPPASPLRQSPAPSA